MAKKKQDLTPEELLEQALVPEHEWPFRVPENWVWTKMDCIMDVRDGTHDTPKYFAEGIPLITSKNLVDGTIDFTNIKYISVEDHIKISERSNVSNGDILMAMIGTIGHPVVVNKTREFSIKNVALFKKSEKSPILSQLACYYLLSEQESMRDKASGGLQPFVSLTFLRNYYFPLPPLTEQQRIVDRIESLFEKLDQAKGLIQDALDSFENRKTAILHKAFSGDLTKKWRVENGVGMESWENTEIGKLLKPMTTVKPSGEVFKYIDIDAVDNKRQIVTSPKIIKIEEAPSRASRGLSSGDVLFSMVRPYLKNIAFITDELSECIASTGFYVCKSKESLEPKFLYYYLCSKEAIDYLMQFMKGDNSPSIRKDDFEGLVLNLPSPKEQNKIIEILENLLYKEDVAKQQIELIDELEKMKKSILARAFRGELGTNYPSEEHAIHLLEKMFSESGGEL